MPGLSQLLERLRRVPLPPGAAAGAVAVPAAGDVLAGEVSFVFPELDAIERRTQATVAAAHAEAVRLRAAATLERHRLLDEARTEADRLAAVQIAEWRAGCRERSLTMLDGARREADRVLTRGRERTPALVEKIVARILEDGR